MNTLYNKEKPKLKKKKESLSIDKDQTDFDWWIHLRRYWRSCGQTLSLFTLLFKRRRGYDDREKEKKKAPFLKKRPTHIVKSPTIYQIEPFIWSPWSYKMYKWSVEWDLPEGSRRLKGLSPGACSSGSRRDRHCRRSLWGRGPGSRRWADPTRTGRNTPSVPCGGPSLWADHSHNMRWSVTIVWRL